MSTMIPTALVSLAVLGSLLGVWYLLVEEHKDRRPRLHARLKWSVAIIALTVDVLGVLVFMEAGKAEIELAVLHKQVDDFQGGRLTNPQKASLIHRWKNSPHKEPIAMKKPRDFAKMGWFANDIMEMLVFASDWQCVGEWDVPNTTDDMTVYLLARRSSPGLLELNAGLQENKIPCKVIVDSRFMREEILIAIGCPPADEPRFENEKREN